MTRQELLEKFYAYWVNEVTTRCPDDPKDPWGDIWYEDVTKLWDIAAEIEQAKDERY